MIDHTPATPHLTEEERHALAAGLPLGEHARGAEEHVRECAECAADTRALEATMTRVRAASLPPAPADEMWPAIRSRIEQRKTLPLPPPMPTARRARWRWAAASVLAAAAVIAIVLARPATSSHSSIQEPTDAGAPDAVVPVADSIQSYEAEARVLLNHLEVERAVMRPEAAAIIDRDLKVIDSAIDELQLAIANDPKNAALRQLLAESYRQKVELLKRAENAS
jgi:anti-sigma-K factor RskA